MKENIQLIPMPQGKFGEYLAFLENLFAEQTAEALGLKASELKEYSHKTLEALMPQGFQTPNARFFEIAAKDETVGAIWFALEEDLGRKVGFIRYIHVDEVHRRKGYARGAIMILEEMAKNEFNLSHLYLNVYGFNKKARSLYESMGFRPLRIGMEKSLRGISLT